MSRLYDFYNPDSDELESDVITSPRKKSRFMHRDEGGSLIGHYCLVMSTGTRRRLQSRSIDAGMGLRPELNGSRTRFLGTLEK